MERSIPRLEPAKIDNEVQILTERIVRGFDPLQVILFGSRARGDADERSDVDLLVVLAEAKDKRKTTVDILRSLADLPVAKDVVVTTPMEIAERGEMIGCVLRYALREGKLVYERKSA